MGTSQSIKFGRLVGLTASLFIARGAALAQTNAPEVRPKYRATQTFVWDFSWLAGLWKARENAPYAEYRKRIDALGNRSAGGDVAARREIVSLAERYRDASTKSPSDPLVLYEHLYAAYMACQRDPRLWNALGLSMGVDRLKRLAPPHTWEYARLLFVIDAVPLPHQTMWFLGERLLKIDPDDRRVTHLLASRLVPSKSEAERKAAVAWADRLVQRWPDNPRSYTAKGKVYYDLYGRFRHRPDGILAVESYREYLRRAPANDPGRKDIEEVVAYINRWLEENKTRS